MTERARRSTTRADRTLVIERIFDAPREMVFKVWTDPEHADEWWGPMGLEVTMFEMDVRPGGAWRKRMRAKDGTDHWRSGVYREVVEPERLVFTYLSDDPNGERGTETVVTVTFEEYGEGQTKLTLHQTGFDTVASRDAHTGGWTSCLERIAEHMSRTEL